MPVFVSHAAADRGAVKDIVEILSEGQIDVWYDQDLHVGDVWWTEILRRIRQCQVFIFVVSEASVRSKPCLAELQYAKDLNRFILPIEVQKLGNRAVNPVSDIQTIPLMRITRPSAVRLVAAAVQGQVESHALPAPLPQEPAIPYAYLQELLVRIQNSNLGPDEQLATTNMLRQNYENETNVEARERIVEVLRELASRPWATEQTLQRVEQILGRKIRVSVPGFQGRARASGANLGARKAVLKFFWVVGVLVFLAGLLIGLADSQDVGMVIFGGVMLLVGGIIMWQARQLGK